METRKVDVAVVGAGTAGLNARRAAERAGASTLLIEAGPHGTTCARVGCMPSKLLIAAASAAHDVARAGRFGVRVDRGAVRVDGRAVMGRVQRERDRFVGFVLDSVESLPEGTRLDGRARFTGPTTLEVEGPAPARVEARAVVIAIGTVPFVPPALEPAGDRLLTSDDVFDLPDLPESVAVVGTGAIGLELGQALHRLGVRVEIFGHTGVLGLATDPEVQRATREVLGAELAIRLETAVESAAPDGNGGVRLRWRAQGGERGEASFQYVLAATGRRPRLDRLGLEAAGIAVEDGRVRGFDPRTLQVADRAVFLAGDVNGERAVLHEAADEGKLAGANAAAFPEARALVRRTPLGIAFTHPEIAVVGCAFADLEAGTFELGSVDYRDQGRARVMGLHAGHVRVYADHACGRLLGAEMIGPRVEHTAHLLAWAVQAGLTVQQALDMPFYHPVVEEGIQTALRELAANLKQRPPRRPRDLECGPGN